MSLAVIIGAGGLGGGGGIESTLKGGDGGDGNSGYAAFAINYLVPTDNYYFINDSGSTNNISDADIISFVKANYADSETYIGQVTINQTDLGINIFDNDLTDIIIAKDAYDLPYIKVLEGSSLATAVNGNDKWIPIRLGPVNKVPLIKYSSDDVAWETVIGLDGIPISDNIRNYNFDGQYVSFEVSHFSTYGTAIINDVSFSEGQIVTDNLNADYTVTVSVKDSMGDIIENAPVTVSIISGSGTLNGTAQEISLTTNAQGIVTVNYLFPGYETTAIVRAEVDGVYDNVIFKNGGFLTDSESFDYAAWATNQVPSNIGGYNDDPDGDGVSNIFEWNYGEDSTSANVWDTDGDGINDKWDAYPNDNSQTVFNVAFNAVTSNGETFTGTTKNVVVLAPSTNLIIAVDGESYQVVGSANGLIDLSHTILEINGLSKESVRDGALSFASTTYQNNIYKELLPNETYSVMFSYINRGNDTDSYGSTVNLLQEETRWSTSYSNSNLTGVAPWSVASLEVAVLPTNALAYEQVTLNVEIGLDNNYRLIDEYQAHPFANINNTYNDEGYYGGVQNFSYQYLLKAQGINLLFINKSAELITPNNYTGVSLTPENIPPGTKIKYSIALINNSFSVAPSVNLKDKIPNNCHLYYDETENKPTIEGTTQWDWLGAEDNTATAASENAVLYEVTIPARTVVTASYMVTVD